MQVNLLKIATIYSCFIIVIDRIFFGFPFVINPFGFFEWAYDAGLPKGNLVDCLKVKVKVKVTFI